MHTPRHWYGHLWLSPRWPLSPEQFRHIKVQREARELELDPADPLGELGLPDDFGFDLPKEMVDG